MTFGRLSLAALNALGGTLSDVGCFRFFTNIVIYVNIKLFTNKQFIVSSLIIIAYNLSHHCRFKSNFSKYFQILFSTSQFYFLNILYVQLQMLYMVQNYNIFFEGKLFGGCVLFLCDLLKIKTELIYIYDIEKCYKIFNTWTFYPRTSLTRH